MNNWNVATVRVQVAHSVPVINAGIRAILESTGEFDLVADPSRGPADVLIADVDARFRALGGEGEHQRVLIVSQDDGEAPIRKALSLGVRGFLPQNCGSDELRNAVKTVSQGGTAFAPSVAHRIVQFLSFAQLTQRELEVLHLMVHGLSDKDIARKLLIALGTAKTHVGSILNKLGAVRRTEAVAIAQRRGLVRLDRPVEYAKHLSLPSAASTAFSM